jgi:large subunit ribosomal protein L43
VAFIVPPFEVADIVNGREKVICVRNLDPNQIVKKAELLRDASGKKLRRVTKKVETQNVSVRGIWSPFHTHNTLHGRESNN